MIGAGVVRAGGSGRWWWAVDVVALLSVAGLALLVRPWLAAAVLLLGLVLEAVSLGRWGLTAGHLVLGLRTVDVATGVPPGWGGLLSGRLVTTDVRRGRDPLEVAAREDAGRVPIPAVDPWGSSPGRVRRWTLVVDDGRVIDVDAPLVLGRRPSDVSGTRTPVSLTDLSRTLSRNHVTVAPGADGLVVMDLGSANGTSLAVGGGSFEAIPAGVEVVVPFGARLAVGDRILVVAEREGAS